MTNENDTFALPDETVAPEPQMEEVFPLVDPDKVEADLRQQFQEMQENMPPADVAAHFFKMYYPPFKGLLGGLSNKDARRVAEHIVQWPLEVQHPKFNDEKALQAFQLGVRLLDCKFIMKSVVEMERLQQAQADIAKAEAEKQTTEQTAQAEQGDVTNG